MKLLHLSHQLHVASHQFHVAMLMHGYFQVSDVAHNPLIFWRLGGDVIRMFTLFTIWDV